MAIRPNLVVIRAGDTPHYGSWGNLSRQGRNWDCFVNYYGQLESPQHVGQEATFRHGVTKFGGISEIFHEKPHLIKKYDAFLFLDDDVEITPNQIDRFFELFHEHNLMLAQPALHPDSFFNHTVTLRDPGYVLRYTRFVEIMMPAFSRDALAHCLPTFRMSVSGWGLDYLWPLRLSYAAKRIAVVDAVAVRHKKPSDPEQGEFYHMLRRLNVDAHAELDEIVHTHRIDTTRQHRVDGGLKHAAWWRVLPTRRWSWAR